MENLTFNITQKGADERDVWQTEAKLTPNEKIITNQLKSELDDKIIFNGRGVASVEISIEFPKSEYTKDQCEDTFSYENGGYIQDEDENSFYAEYYMHSK